MKCSSQGEKNWQTMEVINNYKNKSWWGMGNGQRGEGGHLGQERKVYLIKSEAQLWRAVVIGYRNFLRIHQCS